MPDVVDVLDEADCIELLLLLFFNTAGEGGLETERCIEYRLFGIGEVVGEDDNCLVVLDE